MRAGFWCWMSLLTMVCAPHSQAIQSGTQPSKGAKVYFQGKGPDREVRRFQKFLEIALEDLDMTRTESAQDADITLSMDITREDTTEHLYAPVVWIAIKSNDHQEYVLKSCNSVSTSIFIFDEPIKSIETIKLPSGWKKRNSRLAVFLKEPEAKGMKDLLPEVKENLTGNGYQIAPTRANADAELQNIKLQKLAIPMKAMTVRRSYEIFDRQSNRPYSTSKGYGEVIYVSVDPAVKLENLPCRSTVETFGQDNDSGWRIARNIAKDIRKHLDKAAHSN